MPGSRARRAGAGHCETDVIGMLKRRGMAFAICACLPVVVLYGAFYLMPLLATIVTSFMKWDKINIEGFAGLANYARLFRDPVFYISVKNILSWVSIAVFVHIPFAVMVALMLSTKMRGWKFLRTAYFVPQIISSVAWATIFISVFNPSYGLLNGVLSLVGQPHMARNWLFDPVTAWGAIICTWLFFIGMYSMIMLAELISIPEEVLQSAAIDGANLMQTAIFIKLPAMRLVTGTCMILTVTGGIRFFDGLYIMTNGAPNYRTETLALYLYQQYSYADFSYANTIGVFLLCMGMVLVSLVMWGMGTNRPHELD